MEFGFVGSTPEHGNPRHGSDEPDAQALADAEDALQLLMDHRTPHGDVIQLLMEDEYDENELDEQNYRVFRAKWTCDGSRTLYEAREKLHAFAQDLLELEEEGWELESVADDDYLHVVRKDNNGN